MNCKIIAIDDFKRDARKLLKKYSSLKIELTDLQEKLLLNPRMGILVTENTYKIRLAVKSKGKSGGLRIITHIVEVEIQVAEDTEQEITIYLIAIYDKSKTANISKQTLKSFINEIGMELDNEEDNEETKL